MQDTSPANILSNYHFEVLRLPQRILFEELLKVLVQDGHKRGWLLAAALAEQQEELDILGIDKLGLCLRIGCKNSVHGGIWAVEFRVALKQRRAALTLGEALLNTVDKISCKLGVRLVNPARLVLHLEEINQAANNLAISLVLEIDGLTSLVATKPHLLEVVIKLLDYVRTVLRELQHALLLGKAEDLLIHLSPELDTASGELVNRLAHLGSDNDDPTSGTLVGLLPLGIIESLCLCDRLLGVLAGVRLLSRHHAATKQASIKGHRYVTKLARPGTSDVRIGILGATEPAASNQDEVLASADSTVHLQD